MVLVVLYAVAGVYLGVLAFGWIHRKWWAKIDPYSRSNVRLAVSILAVGSIALAIYHAHLYSEFRQRPPGPRQTPGVQQPPPGGPPAQAPGAGLPASDRD